jgi:hypothetical protein
MWFQDNNLSLNVIKKRKLLWTTEKGGQRMPPILINGAAVSRLRASSSLVSTSPTNYHVPNTPKQS